ncbi:ATP-binding protein [Spirochaetia bacterium 38H-sp]|uniref:histidine kinase n=1 Tax=Rarispira pelagica TaxID=3141764 RepID=A0ABU9U9U7_9SPIR
MLHVILKKLLVVFIFLSGFSILYADTEHFLINLSGQWQIEGMDFKVDKHFVDMPIRYKMPVEKGTVILRKKFIVPYELGIEKLYLMVERLPGAYKYYFNGYYIGEEGGFPPKFFHSYREIFVRYIPVDFINWGRENELVIIAAQEKSEIRIFDVGFINSDNAKFIKNIKNFLNVRIYGYFGFLTFFVAIYFFAHYRSPVKITEKRSYLFYSLSNIFMSYYFFRMSYPFPFLPPVFSYTLSKAAIVLAFAYLQLFYFDFFSLRINPRLKRFILYFAWSIVGIMFFIAKDYQLAERAFALGLVASMAFLIGYIAVSVHAVRRRLSEATGMLLGTSVLVLSAIHDIGYKVAGVLPVLWLQGIGAFVFEVFIFSNLALKTMRMRAEVENFSRKIEQEVSQRTADLNKLNAKLQQISREKSLFIANISHEMRTPLTSIVGYAEMLKDKADGEISKIADIVFREGIKLRDLINQVMDISKIEQGRMEVEKKVFSPKETANMIKESLDIAARKKHVELRLQLPDSCPDWIKGDEVKFEHVLRNLVSNAVKFTENGHVDIKMFVKDNTENILFVEVEDTGYGIPEDKLEKIFLPFEQADNSTTRRFGGSGLGLYIVKEYVKLMGGDVSIESTVGKGTRAVFYIPYAEADYAEHPHTTEETIDINDVNLDGVSVLFADDYPQNQELVSTFLTDAGARVDIASDGAKAVNMVLAQQYDIVLMDIHMPTMDGLEATRRIRARGLVSIPIIAITADTYKEDVDRFMAAGMSGVLPKPIRKKELLSLVNDIVKNRKLSQEETRFSDSSISDYGDDIYGGLVSFVEEFGEMKQKALEILSGFIDECDNQWKRIDAAWEKRDWTSFHREVHSLKGGAANVYAEALRRAALEVEKAAKAHLEDGMESRLDSLRSVYAEFKAAVTDFLDMRGYNK